MKSLRLLAIVSAMILCWCVGNAVAAERIVVVTHGSNTDAFWNVVKNGVTAAAKDMKIKSDPTEVRNRVTAYLSAHPEIDGILTLGPTGADPTLAALKEMGKAGKIHFGTFDLGDSIIEGIKNNQIAFAIDQQQYLQGYLPMVSLALYARYGLLPGGDILSGPGFVTKGNIAKVEKLAGKIR